jgi:hypothetical protein
LKYAYEYKYKYRSKKEESEERSGDYKKSLKKAQKKAPIKRGELLSEAVWGALWNIFFILQPIAALNQYFTDPFLEFIRLTASVSLAISLVKLLRVFAGNYQILTQQVLLIGLVVGSVLMIPIYYDAIQNPDVLMIFSDLVSFDWNPTNIFRIVCWIALVASGLRGLDQLGKVASYPSRLRKYTKAMEALRT